MELTSSPYCRYSSSPAEAIAPCADLLDLHPSIFPHSSFANSLCLQNRPNCGRPSLPLPPRTVHLGNGRPMQTTLLATFSHNAIGTFVSTRGSTTVTLSKLLLGPLACLLHRDPTLSNLARGYRWCSCLWDYHFRKGSGICASLIIHKKEIHC